MTIRRKKRADPTPQEPSSQAFRRPTIRTNGRVREITIPVGREVYSPIDYHSFEVASLAVTIELADDDDVDDVVASAREVLRRLQKEEFDHVKKRFVAMAKDAIEEVRQVRGRDIQPSSVAR